MSSSIPATIGTEVVIVRVTETDIEYFGASIVLNIILGGH